MQLSYRCASGVARRGAVAASAAGLNGAVAATRPKGRAPTKTRAAFSATLKARVRSGTSGPFSDVLKCPPAIIS